ncbi:MAG: hypothetical protein IJT13_03405 [Bacteroidaceae bacterium]|nr:hypothetical protein [Bacteroidaceae bacterium]MBR6215033.1 hypothetical protein [Spirochaetaceae bacterium]
MKKLLFSVLFAFVLTLGFTSCGTDPVASVEKLTEKVQKEAKDMTKEDCATLLKELADIETAFYAANPDEDAVAKYKEAKKALFKAAAEADPAMLGKIFEAQKDLMENDADFKAKVEELDKKDPAAAPEAPEATEEATADSAAEAPAAEEPAEKEA